MSCAKIEKLKEFEMRKNKVKSLWEEGKVPTVAWLDTADTFVAETIANIGFDVLVLDM